MGAGAGGSACEAGGAEGVTRHPSRTRLQRDTGQGGQEERRSRCPRAAGALPAPIPVPARGSL